MELDSGFPKNQPLTRRDTSVGHHGEWTVVTIHDRLDSFNADGLISQVDALLASNKPYLILNLETTSFMSIPFIKKMSFWAKALKRKNLPLVLLKPSEKLARQIDIFASLKDLNVIRSESELPVVDES